MKCRSEEEVVWGSSRICPRSAGYLDGAPRKGLGPQDKFLETNGSVFVYATEHDKQKKQRNLELSYSGFEFDITRTQLQPRHSGSANNARAHASLHRGRFDYTSLSDAF